MSYGMKKVIEHHETKELISQEFLKEIWNNAQNKVLDEIGRNELFAKLYDKEITPMEAFMRLEEKLEEFK